MKHPERVEDCLGHIAEAIQRAASYVHPLPDRHAFEQNPQVQDAVVRNIEIIGEAVNHINSAAPEFIAHHPELPWQQMRDMRNLVEIVWRTAKEDLPKLKQQVDHLLMEVALAQRPNKALNKGRNEIPETRASPRFGTYPIANDFDESHSPHRAWAMRDLRSTPGHRAVQRRQASPKRDTGDYQYQ